MDSIDFNISEVDLFLLDGTCLLGDYSEENDETMIEKEAWSPRRMTHGGVEFVENPRRIYLDVSVQELVLTICGTRVDDEIVRIAAVNSETSFRTFPDEKGRMEVRVTLLDLVCEDIRQKTAGRQYKSMIHQPKLDVARFWGPKGQGCLCCYI